MSVCTNNVNDTFVSILLSEIELCLNQRKGSLHLKDSNQENGNPGQLLSNVLFQSISEKNGQEPLTHRQRAEYRQWIEYISVYGHLLQSTSTSQQVLKELNCVLGWKSYLASNTSQTVIDALFFGLVYGIMAKISHQEKEQYIHLSRWFNTLQQDAVVRKARSPLTFSRCLLYS